VEGAIVVLARDTQLTLVRAAALVNTSGGMEQLTDRAALDRFTDHWGWPDNDHHCATTELRDVRELRSTLRDVWQSGEDRVVEIVNALLKKGDALPQLIELNDAYHLRAIPNDDALAARIAVAVAMALAEVVRCNELPRLRICEYPECRNVVVDLSKNKSRRFCDGNCGNRAAVAAYRKRKCQA
jgi:predicted RNA-binding Zn ribbon-like protein